MKLSFKKLLVGGLGVGVVALATFVGGPSANATSFSAPAPAGETGNLRYNSSTEWCNAAHSAFGTTNGHNACGPFSTALPAAGAVGRGHALLLHQGALRLLRRARPGVRDRLVTPSVRYPSGVRRGSTVAHGAS